MSRFLLGETVELTSWSESGDHFWLSFETPRHDSFMVELLPHKGGLKPHVPEYHDLSETEERKLKGFTVAVAMIVYGLEVDE